MHLNLFFNMFNHSNNIGTTNVLQAFQNIEKEQLNKNVRVIFFSVALLLETCKESSGLICY